MTYPDTLEGVRAMLTDEVDEDTLEELARLEASGDYEWIPDDGFPEQWGLVRKGTNEAVAIAYLYLPDFELGAWDEALEALR